MAVTIIILLLLYLLVFLVNKKYAYFADRKIPFLRPSFPFGNIKGLGSKKHISTFVNENYKELKKIKGKFSFGGLFMFFTPIYFILDLKLVKNVFVKDFNYFTDRTGYFNEKDEPISAHLFVLEGQRWKSMRSKLTPTFTSGKMKMMMSIFTDVAKELVICVDDAINKNSVIEMRDIFARFTTDVIGTCAFGIECNSLKDPDTEFRKMGKKVLEEPHRKGMEFFLILAFKNLARKLGVVLFETKVSHFFMSIVRDTIGYREKHNIERKDLMQLLIQLKNNGSVDGAKSDGKEPLTVNEITAQVFLFFMAGFDTSSTTMSFALLEIAENHKIQQRLRKEIEDVVKSHNGELTYEGIMEMHYLDQVVYGNIFNYFLMFLSRTNSCFTEALRKYPILSSIDRVAISDYKVPETDVIIKKGQQVWIPVYGIHHDPEIYPDPEKFDPERFSPEEVKKRDQYAFLSFGEGPRNCIGMRFAMMQMKVGLATFLFNYEVTSKTKYPVEFSINSYSIFLSPKDGIWVDVKKLIK